MDDTKPRTCKYLFASAASCATRFKTYRQSQGLCDVQVDRSTVALYYSGNAMDWVQAGILDYHLSFGRHFTYPHMLIDGDDLLVVMRATYAPAGDDSPPPDSPYGGYYKCVVPTANLLNGRSERALTL